MSMSNQINRALSFLVCLVSVAVCTAPASAQVTVDGIIDIGEYSNSLGGAGGSFGDFFGAGSTLYWDTNGTSLFIGLEATSNGGDNAGVLYFDTVAGGPSTTADINNVSGGNDQTYIAGSVMDPGTGDPFNASDLTFAPGFAPEFGLLMEFGGFNSLYPIVSNETTFDVGGGLGSEASVNSEDNLVREIEILLSTLAPSGDIDFVGTVISNTAWRSNEFFGVTSTIPENSIERNPYSLEEGDFVTIALAPSGDGDFDGDTDVDGADFLLWQRNQAIGSLADWQSNYGPGSLLTAGLTAVPEPSALLLLALALPLTQLQRTRRSAN